jgi:3-hydroxymyristoyl/3-hydroxydecanoyl-(acyl carrier protein) dehydratase
MATATPEIRSTERTANGVRIELYLQSELSYFQGHFSGCPILPGVVQVTWAIEFGRQQLAFEGRFRALRAVKFMRIIVPNTTAILQLEYDDATRELEFAFDIDARACSSGTVLFGP